MQGNDPRRQDANLARNLALAALAGVIGALAYIELAAKGLAVLSLIAVTLVVGAMLMLWGLGAARRSQRARPHHYVWAVGALAGLTLVGLGLALWPRGVSRSM
jgi:undecaprenyl pyrophosphate phosphatase UppP